MNWQLVTAIAALCGAIFGPISSLAVGAFIYGKLTQSVTDTREDVKELKGDVHGLKEDVREHGEAIAALEARPRYVNGASH